MATRKHKGLGKGLAALISEDVHFNDSGDIIAGDQAGSEAPAPDQLVFEVAIDKIRPSKGQPRKQFDKQALEELSVSIREHGILQPLVVKPEDKGYSIIAGERRWRASRIAGLKQVPVIVRDLPARDVIEIALIENVQREDLNPIEEAMAYEHLIKAYHLTQGEIGIRIGKSRTAVTNTMRLLKLPESVREMVLEDLLSSGHARALLGLEDPRQMAALAKEIVQKKYSVRETEKKVQALKNPKKPRPKIERDPYIVDVEDHLRDQFKTGVRIIPQGKKGKGKIELAYYSLEDLNRILDLLK